MSDSDSSEISTTGETASHTHKAKSARRIIGINFTNNPDLLPAFWATVNAHFQKIMDKFLVSDSWNYQAFKRIAEKLGIELVFKSTLTQQGDTKQRYRHFEVATQAIYEAAKFQWLAPWRQIVSLGSTTCMKRQVGGLFLLHLFASKQVDWHPQSHRRQTVHLDTKDVKAILVFFDHFNKKDGEYDVQNIPDIVKQQVGRAYVFLKDNELVSYSLLTDDYGTDSATIYLLEMKNNLALQHLGTLKDIRDTFLYEACQGTGNLAFKELLKNGHHLNWIAQSSTTTKGSEHGKTAKVHDQASKFPLKRKKDWTVADVEELGKERDLAVIAFRLIEILKYLTPPNPLTEERLTGQKNLRRMVVNEISEINLKNQNDLKWRNQNPSRVLRRGRRKYGQEKKSMPSNEWRNYLGEKSVSDSKDNPAPSVSAILAVLKGNQKARLQFYPEVAIVYDDKDATRPSTCTEVVVKTPLRLSSAHQNQTTLSRNVRELSPDNGSVENNDSDWETDVSSSEYSDFDDELALADDFLGLSMSRSSIEKQSNHKPSRVIFSKSTKTVLKKTDPVKTESCNSSWLDMPTFDSLSGPSDVASTPQPSTSTNIVALTNDDGGGSKTGLLKQRQMYNLFEKRGKKGPVHTQSVKAIQTSASPSSSASNKKMCTGSDNSSNSQVSNTSVATDDESAFQELLRLRQQRIEIQALEATWKEGQIPKNKTSNKSVPTTKHEKTKVTKKETQVPSLTDNNPVPGPSATPYSLRTVRKKNPKYSS